MNFTKKERHQLYKKLLEIVCKDSSCEHGICYYLEKLAGKGEYISMSNFREIFIQRPKFVRGHYGYWFPRTVKGWKKRIDIIEKAIEMTKS